MNKLKYLLSLTPRFKRDYKRLKRKHIKLNNFNEILNLLRFHHLYINKLRNKYKDHALHGNESGNRELHIAPNILLKYQIHNKELVLVLLRLGPHGGKHSIFK